MPLGTTFQKSWAERRTLPHGVPIAAGWLSDTGHVFKFGFNADIASGTQETVWDEGGLYSYLAAATTLKISSADANDAAAGTGARTVQIVGLDANFADQSEIITLNGQTAVNTANQYIRVFRLIVLTAGTGLGNAGKIYAGTGDITAGVPDNIFAAVMPGLNQTLMAIYTIPAAKSGCLLGITASSFGNQNAAATVELRVRPESQVFQVKDRFLITRGSVRLPHDVPIPFAAKTDIEMRGQSSGADIDVSATFDILLTDV